MHVRSGQESKERNTVFVRDEVAFRPCLAPVGRVFARFVPPLGAGTEEASRQARDQSIGSAMPNLSKSRRGSLSQRPVFCPSLRRRQQVIPEPPPISLGRYSHAMPVSK